MLALINAPDDEARLVLTEVPDPQPADGEAVIRVHTTSVNRGELNLLAARPPGWRPGWDIAGVVEQAAADGSGPAVGTRVAAMAAEAGWAELAPVPVDRIARLPETISMDAAATLPTAGTAALRMLRLGGQLDGRRVLITGGSGAVGRFEVQLASAQGAQVSAVASDRYSGDLLALGTADVVPDVASAPGPFDLITESVGGQSLADAIGQISPGGTIVVFGASSGEPTRFSFRQFSGGHEGARLQTFMLFASGPGFGVDIEVLAGMAAEGRLQTHIGETAPWTDAPRVVRAMRERALDGKAVLRVHQG